MIEGKLGVNEKVSTLENKPHVSNKDLNFQMPKSVRFSELSAIHLLMYSDKDGVYFRFESVPLPAPLPLPLKEISVASWPFLNLSTVIQLSFPYNLQAFLFIMPKSLIYSIKFWSGFLVLFLPLLPISEEKTVFIHIWSFLNLFFYTILDLNRHLVGGILAHDRGLELDDL